MLDDVPGADYIHFYRKLFGSSLPEDARALLFVLEEQRKTTMADMSLPRPGCCKWAEGDAGNYVFPCSTRVEQGVSYCAEHSAIVYIPPEERRRSRSGGGMSLSFRRAA